MSERVKNKCETCGAEAECRRCGGPMAHVHFTTGEPPSWFHTKRRPAPAEEKPR